MTEPNATTVDELLNRLVLDDDEALQEALTDSTAAGLPAIEDRRRRRNCSRCWCGSPGRVASSRSGRSAATRTICLARAAGRKQPRDIGIRAAACRGGRRQPAPGRGGRPGGDHRRGGAGHVADVDCAFDFVFIDADKENNSAYVQWAIELGRPGTVIVVDNIVRDGRILDPAADDHQARAVRDMLEMMGRHPKLDTAAIQTVGLKGWDGFALALVR